MPVPYYFMSFSDFGSSLEKLELQIGDLKTRRKV